MAFPTVVHTLGLNAVMSFYSRIEKCLKAHFGKGIIQMTEVCGVSGF